jgi:hypothetical protein
MTSIREQFERIKEALKSDDPLIRWWGYQGLIDLLAVAGTPGNGEIQSFLGKIDLIEPIAKDINNYVCRDPEIHVTVEALGEGYALNTWSNEHMTDLILKEFQRYYLCPSVEKITKMLRKKFAEEEPTTTERLRVETFIIEEISDLQ